MKNNIISLLLNLFLFLFTSQLIASDQAWNIAQEGNKIILFTARGSKTGLNHENLTKIQLKQWGVKFNELLFGKPNADYYIDDKSFDYFNWFNEEKTK